MNRFSQFVFILSAFFYIGCGPDKNFDNSIFSSNYSGSVVVSTVATDPSTGPGIVSLFDSTGQLVRVLHDYFLSGEFPTGLAFLSPSTIIVSIDGTDRVDQLSLADGTVSPFAVSPSITAAPLRQIARSEATGSVYIVESSTATIEKVDATGTRVGNPFIPTTVGACTLVTPYGIAYIPTTQRIAVISSAAAGKLQIYDKNGACITQVTTAPFNTGTPTGIAYDAVTDKLIVTFSTTHAIYAVSTTGTSPQQIFLNSAVIFTPKAVTTDLNGYIYVGSNGTDTVEKLFFDGTTATRVTPGPFIGPSVNSQNPTSISVVP